MAMFHSQSPICPMRCASFKRSSARAVAASCWSRSVMSRVMAKKQRRPSEVETSQADLHRKGGAILAPVAAVKEKAAGPELDLAPGRLRARQVEDDLDVEEIHRQQLLAGVAETGAGLRIHIEEPAGVVVDEHGVRRLLHVGAQAVFARPQLRHQAPTLGFAREIIQPQRRHRPPPRSAARLLFPERSRACRSGSTIVPDDFAFFPNRKNSQRENADCLSSACHAAPSTVIGRLRQSLRCRAPFAKGGRHGAVVARSAIRKDFEPRPVNLPPPRSSQWSDHLARRIVPADPSHVEAAKFHEHLADFAEKRVAFRRPDDRLIDLAERRVKPAQASDLRLLRLAVVGASDGALRSGR